MLIFERFFVVASRSPCFCPQGYFISVDDECVACPKGTVCSRNGGSTQERLQLLPGYWRVSLNSDEIFECPYPKGCIGDNGTLAADLNYGSDDANSTTRKQRRLSRYRVANHQGGREGADQGGRKDEVVGTQVVALSSSSSSSSPSSSSLGERKSRLLGAVPGDAFGDAYCNVGYMGPLCGVCDTSSVPSYYFDVDAEE